MVTHILQIFNQLSIKRETVNNITSIDSNCKKTQEQGQNINYWVCAFFKDRDTYKDFEATDAKLGRLEQTDGSVGN